MVRNDGVAFSSQIETYGTSPLSTAVWHNYYGNILTGGAGSYGAGLTGGAYRASTPVNLSETADIQITLDNGAITYAQLSGVPLKTVSINHSTNDLVMSFGGSVSRLIPHPLCNPTDNSAATMSNPFVPTIVGATVGVNGGYYNHTVTLKYVTNAAPPVYTALPAGVGAGTSGVFRFTVVY
jgi:hypothetical protein